MPVLVTGANGFIGSALVEKLLAGGHAVRCLVRKTSDLTWLRDLPVTCSYADLRDVASLAGAVADAEMVFHLAGVTKARDEQGYLQGNYQTTVNLLDACARHAPSGQRFIYVSSQAAAGPSLQGVPLTEQDPAQPISLYGEAKWRAEQAVRAYSRDRFATIIRPPSVYGARDRDIHVYFQSVQKGFLLLLGSGTQKISLVHVRDLVNGMMLAAQQEIARGKTYFITGAEDYDWITIGQSVAAALDKRPLIVKVPVWMLNVAAFFSVASAHLRAKPALLNRDKLREMKQPAWLCSSALAQRELGYKPEVSLQQGIAETAQWYRDQGWL